MFSYSWSLWSFSTSRLVPVESRTQNCSLWWIVFTFQPLCKFMFSTDGTQTFMKSLIVSTVFLLPLKDYRLFSPIVKSCQSRRLGSRSLNLNCIVYKTSWWKSSNMIQFLLTARNHSWHGSKHTSLVHSEPFYEAFKKYKGGCQTWTLQILWKLKKGLLRVRCEVCEFWLSVSWSDGGTHFPHTAAFF